MSPVRITKVNGFRVKTPGKARNTTKKKAKAQKRLLNAAKTHHEHLAERMTT